MKISILSSEIKVMAALSVLLSVVGGCAPVVANAPFPSRSDTVSPGSLLGPFDGRVLDASNGKPIQGAVVYATWRFEIGQGLTAPAGAGSAAVETDADGYYLIPRLDKLPGGRTRVTAFTLIAYKRGFIGYRSDRRFDDLGHRHDFSQFNNVAKLERFPSTLSHVKHVRFVGGGGELRRAMAAEVVQASLELGAGGSEARPGVTGPVLDATVLLAPEELKAVTGFDGGFAIEKLADLPQTTSYDSVHFKAKNQPESFDAAIRVWKLASPAAATARYGTLLKEVPHAEEKDEVGDRSLRGWDGKILAAATLDRERNLVIQLTCGVDQCRDAEQVVALLRRVLTRADRLAKAIEPEKVEEPAPVETKTQAPDDDNPFKLRPPGLKR